MLKILVVDDTPSARELIANYLRKRGHEVIEANNGKEALAKAIDNLPDIVVTDIVMPEMNGFELCRSLKKNPVTKNSRIVVCTSKNQSIDRLWGMKQGADIYLTKPFTEEQIIEAVKSVTT
ncbi:MAG: response regulator [Xenococcaceae cyanobacterium MO_207.B15]|nr:response regulator [Xenococcaceae cyanobacterium MO_207.B15]MDJ0743246.1 response regulator [Xenococcaceae cyanobacterium MO_167.B27]